MLGIRGGLLKEAVNIITSIISKKIATPILQNVYIKFQEGSLYLYSTNLENAVEVVVKDVALEKDDIGKETILPYKIFKEFVSKLSSEENVDIDIKENTCLLKTEDVQFEMNVLPVQDYKDSMLSYKREGKPEVSLRVERTQIEVIEFLASDIVEETVNTNFSSVCVDMNKKGDFIIAGTDGIRLFVYKSSENFKLKDFKSENQILLRAKALNKILSAIKVDYLILNKYEKFTTLEYEDNVYSITIYLPSVDTTYPNYLSIVHGCNFDSKIIINADLFKSSLNKIRPVAKGVQIVKFDISNNKFFAYFEEEGIGKIEANLTKAVEEFDIKKDIVIHLNIEKMYDFINYNKDEKISIYVKEPLKPIVFQNNNSLYILMPINTSEE